MDYDLTTEILKYWNSKDIVVHRKLPKSNNTTLEGALKSLVNGQPKLGLEGYTTDEIKHAIDNYAEVINSDKYYWTYKWNLTEFLVRGFEKFYNDACLENYKKDDEEIYLTEDEVNEMIKNEGYKVADFKPVGGGKYECQK